MKRVHVFWFMVCLGGVFCFCSACSLGQKDYLRIVSYNVENLFDAEHNGTEYPIFLPGKDWNQVLYQEKRARIVAVLDMMDADIISLQEIENIKVLKDLGDLLDHGPYRYMSVSNFPNSAIQTGILSRYPIEAIYEHSLYVHGGTSIRGILEAHILVDEERIAFLVNHWKSKRDGEKSAHIRAEQASLAYSRARELFRSGTESIVILGDYNEDFTETSGAFMPLIDWDKKGIPLVHGIAVSQSVEDYTRGKFLSDVFFVTPFGSSDPGSYWYDGEWSHIDGIFLSHTMLDLYEIVEGEYMFTGDMVTREGAPRSWHRNPGLRGYSDHFPALLVLRKKRIERD